MIMAVLYEYFRGHGVELLQMKLTCNQWLSKFLH